MKSTVGKFTLMGNETRARNRTEIKKPEGKQIRGCKDMEGVPGFG